LNHVDLKKQLVHNKKATQAIYIPLETTTRTIERPLPLPEMKGDKSYKVDHELRFVSQTGENPLNLLHLVVFRMLDQVVRKMKNTYNNRRGEARAEFAKNCFAIKNHPLFRKLWANTSQVSVYHVIRAIQQYIYYRIARFADADVDKADTYIDALKAFAHIMTQSSELQEDNADFKRMTTELKEFYRKVPAVPAPAPAITTARHHIFADAVAVFGSEANIPGLPGSDQVNLFLPGFLHAHASALFKATNSQILTHVRAEHQKHAGATLPLFVGPNGAAGGSVLSSAILHAIPVVDEMNC
jgi:hypothetical protein